MPEPSDRPSERPAARESYRPRGPAEPHLDGSSPADAGDDPAATAPEGGPSGASAGSEHDVPAPGSSPGDAPSGGANAIWADLRRAVGADEVDETAGETGEPDGSPPGSNVDEAVDQAEQAVYDDLATLAAERDDYRGQLVRVKADFENYRKRMIRQQTEHMERAAEGLVEKLLDVLDTFDAALTHGEGFEQVHGALMGVLEKEGLERIDPAGKPFDPNEADAVAHDDGDDGPVVAEVFRAGYRWKGRVLRPAMVKVRG